MTEEKREVIEISVKNIAKLRDVVLELADLLLV